MGNPFPNAFAKQHKSGVTLKYFCAPPNENLNPVTTSSKISRASFLCANFLTFSKNLLFDKVIKTNESELFETEYEGSTIKFLGELLEEES